MCIKSNNNFSCVIFSQNSKVSITLHKSSSSQVHHHHEIKKNKKESPKRERKDQKQKIYIQTSKENINAPQAGKHELLWLS